MFRNKQKKSLIVGMALIGIFALAFTALNLTGCNTDPCKDGHTSNNAQASDCLTPNTCTVCSTVITPAKTSHDWQDTWTIVTYPTTITPALDGMETDGICNNCRKTKTTRPLTAENFKTYFFGTWTYTSINAAYTFTTTITNDRIIRKQLEIATNDIELSYDCNIAAWIPYENTSTLHAGYKFGFELTFSVENDGMLITSGNASERYIRFVMKNNDARIINFGQTNGTWASPISEWTKVEEE